MKKSEMKPIILKHKDKDTGRIVETNYYTVSVKLQYFRKNYPGYSLRSYVLNQTETEITIKAIIADPFGFIVASGIASENKNNGFINKSSHVENCETSAWGRALSNLIGLDAEISSLEELENAQLNQDPITDEQKAIVKKLIYGVDEEAYRRMYKVRDFSEARAHEFMHKLSAEQAQAFIWKLEACQAVKNIDGGPGGYSQGDILKKLDDIQKT
jgi:hypothetical protein